MMPLIHSALSTRSKIESFLYIFTVFFGVCCTVLLAPSLHAATVEPGPPSTLDVTVPNTSRAGSSFSMTISVRDQEGNLVTDYSEYDREILLSTTGAGELSRASVTSDEFEEGRLKLKVSYTVAEKLQVMARERNHVAAGQSKEFTVRPGTPTTFRTNTPSVVKAGQSFNMNIKVFDDYGNIVTRYGEQTNGVRFETTGLERPSPEFIKAGKFENGQIETSLSYTAAETIRVVLIDSQNEIRTLSDTVQVKPANLNNFSLSVPNAARAGEPFRVAIEARDRYGNIVTNYSQVSQGVELSIPGGKKPDPAYVPPENFENGVAFTRLTYKMAGPFKLRAQDRGSSVEGQSDQILLKSGELDRYELTVPEQTRAGVNFRVSVTPLDEFGNPLLDYSGRGPPVILSVRGKDKPRKIIESSQFSDGNASVDFSYKNAEGVRLQAKSQTDGNITGQSKVMLVTPGDPGGISIDVPESTSAGSNFTATLTLKDDYGNRVQETGYLPGKIRVNLMNGGVKQEEVVTPSQFIEGEKQLVFRHETAETVAVFTEYRRFDIRKRGPSINVLPGEFEKVAVGAPGSAQAGSSFKLRLSLLDRYGNELQTLPDAVSSLQILSSGSGKPQPQLIPRSKIEVPTFSVDMNYFIAESASFRIHDSKGNRLGVSPPVRITPGPLESFSFQVPDEVSTDRQFTLRLQATDAYENVLSNFDQNEGSVKLEATGGTTLTRTEISYNDFASGVAEIPISYHKAESIKIIAKSDGIESTSNSIVVNPGQPSRYKVLTQETVGAGEPFPTVIRVFDQFNNPITNLPENFFGVELSNGGSPKISPNKIGAEMFEEGEANVFLAYPESGNIDLSAKPLDSPLEQPVVDRFFIRRDLDTGHIYILSSKSVPLEVNKESGPTSGKIQLNFKPSNLIADARNLRYDDWFIKKIEQRQTQFGSLPTVSLNIFPRNKVTLNTKKENNMLRVRLTRKTTSTTPTLREIQQLIEKQQYQEATDKLNKYLDNNPSDQEALQLRLRLKRLQDLLGN